MFKDKGKNTKTTSHELVNTGWDKYSFFFSPEGI